MGDEKSSSVIMLPLSVSSTHSSSVIMLPLNVSSTHSSSVTLLPDSRQTGHSQCIYCLLPDLFFRMKCKNFIGLNNK